MGIIIGSTNIVSTTATVQAAAYSANDVVGGLITLTGVCVSALDRPTGIIHSVVITDKAAQDVDYDVVFFDTNPSNTTFTENSALTLSDTDLPTIVGVAQVTTHVAFSASGVNILHGANIPFRITDTSTNAIYACIITRGAPTYASTSDVTLRVGILQD